MEEIDLNEIFNYFKGKIGLLIMITCAICLVGCVYGLFIQKPMFQSYTTVILSSDDSTITQNDVTLNRNLVNTYAEIVKSRRVLEQVINELNLDISYETLSSKISVSALNNTDIIKIVVSDRDPKDAKNIANVTAKYFTLEIEELYNMNNVNVLDEAVSSNSPYNINVFKQAFLYFMIGLVLACGFLFLLYYFDRTIKSVQEIEQKIKLPILGSVQQYGKRS